MNPETIVFIVFAIASIAGGIVMVTARNPIYSAMGLLLAMFSVAVFYVLNDAHFVAAVQVLIYAGAVMTLFLFVIMLIGVDKADDPHETIPFQRPLTIVLGLGLLVLLLAAGKAAWVTGTSAFASRSVNGTIEAISKELFGIWLIPLEATILLLTIAAVGTVSLAHFGDKLQVARRVGHAPVPPSELTTGTGRGGTPPLAAVSEAGDDAAGDDG
jgi:NADH-quinone oxidoreductase subunit J